MNRLSVIGAVTLAAVAGSAWWMQNPQTTPASDLTFSANAQESDEVAEIDTSSIIEMSLGSSDAPVTIVEYASFTCPHCASFHKGTFKQLKEAYIDTGKVHFIYRDVYFDRFGLWAAMVARCDGQERFFGISDLIYNQQSEWLAGGSDPALIADNLRKIGKVAGLEEDQLDACLNDNAKAQNLVAWYQENAEADSVRSTPTLVIDGKTNGNMSFSDLAEIIDEKLGE